jgi:nitric oxide reductase subunit B
MGSELPGNGWKWKWAMGLLNFGVLSMTMALLIAGYEQSFIERAVEGSTWGGYPGDTYGNVSYNQAQGSAYE